MEFPRKTRIVSLAVALSMLVSGCVTTGGGNEQAVAGRDDDVCRVQAVALNDSQKFFAEDLLAGIMTGAATGAMTGALGAALSGKDVGKAAAQGAMAGAVAGAAYWDKRMKAGRAEALLGLKTDTRKEIEQLDRTKVAFRQLNDCRKAQFAAIKADYKAKKIAKAEADTRWARQRELLKSDIELAQSINANVVKRGENFAYANEQVNGSTAAKTAKTEASKQAKVEMASLETTRKAATSSKSSSSSSSKTAKAAEPEIQTLETSRQAKAAGVEAETNKSSDMLASTSGGLESDIG